jgi:hypothetical protein
VGFQKANIVHLELECLRVQIIADHLFLRDHSKRAVKEVGFQVYFLH